MGRASTVRSLPDRRQKIAAQRAAAQRRQTRNRLLVACGAVTVVVVTAIALVVAKANTTSSSSPSGLAAPVGPTGQALAALVGDTTSIPAATLNKVSAGSGSAGKLVPITGPRLTFGTKPEVMYIGAEYCPYCAAERWALIVALSRFGTFSGLATTYSASRDGAGTPEPYAYTRTWTFAHATYESKYLALVAVEINNNVPDRKTGTYGTLRTPTHFEQSVMSKYDGPPYVPSSASGTIPFTDFGNRYMITGASYNPAILSGLSWTQIASDLRNPSSQVARAVLGTANYMTAAICQMTNDHPGACTPLIRALQRKI